ncbi:MAG: hypothetical protein KDD09_26740, partial [Phaeodactylibacter sp.]|nr:hypothetical protein [Phaeodactylibacter sp.]
ITLMPPELRWLRVSAHQNAEAFSETRGIFTQAVKVTYKPLENNERDKMVTEAKEIKALAVADSNVKGIEQPYKSFGGRLPEAGNNFSKRASERLRHKGRAVNVFDYERLVLERFPKIYRAKCITHSLGLPAPEYVRDLEVAPGFVNIAVIPDLGQVVSSNQLEPRAPISLLTEIEDYLQAKNSPFVRLKAMNP